LTTENVAVLFTDMVGSTALASSLSAQAADVLRREHFSILRQAVAEAGGTEVKNLGDGLMVVFRSASAALSCAVAMQQGIDRDNRNRDQTVGLRVGLSCGEVSGEDGDYFGDPVIEAARLCARCESGQVLATHVVRLTAGRRNPHECRPVGELALKGLSDPVVTVEIFWEPLGGSAREGVPLPARMAGRPQSGVVGREAETESMLDAYKRVATGEGREVLLVSGEAGLGKTTLVAEVARAAFDAGACVLFGHCEEDLAAPYQFFSEALGHYVTHAPEEQLLAHVGEHGSELARLVPAMASRIPDLPPSRATDTDTERFLLFAAVLGLLSSASAHQPVVLVLDDLQWADTASLLLLRHVIASELPMRVLVLGAHRDSELSWSHPFLETLAALRRQDGVSRIELAGLDDAGVVDLLEATAGHALDSAAVDLAHAVHRETDGNPFFVSEVLVHLAETGVLVQDTNAQWVAATSFAEMTLPNSVREVIGARVGRLGHAAERVLSMAAVIGRDFEFDVLAGATKTDEDDLLDVLDAAAGAGLVRELSGASGRYSFAHSLIQHTLYDDLGPTRRARVHRRVAEAMQELCGDRPGARVEDLARHWLVAEPVDVTKAIDYSRQAGDAALAALAPADAVRYYTQALDLYPQATDPDQVLGLELSIGLGTAQRQTGDAAFRETLLGAARRAAELDDTGRLVAAALANDRGYPSPSGYVGGYLDTDKVEILERALGRLSADSPQRALVLATLCSEISFTRTEESRSLAEEAVAAAHALGDDETIVWVINHVLVSHGVPHLLDRQLAWSLEALALAERIGDPLLLFFAADRRGGSTSRSGDFPEAQRCRELKQSLAKRIDQPFFHWRVARDRQEQAMYEGDADRAELFANEALRIGTEAGEPDAAFFFSCHLLGASIQRGTLGALIPLIEQTAGDLGSSRGLFEAVLALAHAEVDQLGTVRELLDELVAAAFDLPDDATWMMRMFGFAEAAIECGDPKYCGPLFDRLAPFATQWVPATFAGGRVSHNLAGLAAVLGRFDEADAYFAETAALNDRWGFKFCAARTNLLWGNMLAERNAPGDSEKARDLLAKAYAAAAAHGYATVERRAATALGELG
jgi:class 3 adenylate cyclase/tetratricopeptide (TPR) repeat protein